MGFANPENNKQTTKNLAPNIFNIKIAFIVSIYVINVKIIILVLIINNNNLILMIKCKF